MNLTTQDKYWFRLFVAFSLLFAAIFGARMYESACASAWRLRNNRGIKGLWARSTIWLMNQLESNHCQKAAYFYGNIERSHRMEAWIRSIAKRTPHEWVKMEAEEVLERCT